MKSWRYKGRPRVRSFTYVHPRPLNVAYPKFTHAMPVRHTKQVRFAYKNIFHSPPVTPAMPSLSFSSSTAPSSLGAVTPPSVSHPLPPSASQRMLHGVPKASSSTGYAGSTRTHPYFEMSGIIWDMMDHPSTISRHHQSVSSRVWSEPATNPPMPFIVITIPHFAWKFNVYASNHSFVTFEDVVHSVYRSLRKNITQSEFHAAASPAEQRQASRAYEHRYRRQRSTRAYEEEKRGGMKRVDFLMGRTRFVGLVSSGRRSEEWRLDVT